MSEIAGSGTAEVGTPSPQDEWEIRRLLALHGHLVDAGAWDELHRVFAADAELEYAGFGSGSASSVFRGLEGAAEFERRRSSGAAGGPEIHAHHTVNTVIRAAEESSADGSPRAFAWSRSVLVTDAAAALGGDLLDELVRTDAGWRIRRRRVTDRDRGDRRAPGDPYDPSDGESFATWLALR